MGNKGRARAKVRVRLRADLCKPHLNAEVRTVSERYGAAMCANYLNALSTCLTAPRGASTRLRQSAAAKPNPDTRIVCRVEALCAGSDGRRECEVEVVEESRWKGMKRRRTLIVKWLPVRLCPAKLLRQCGVRR